MNGNTTKSAADCADTTKIVHSQTEKDLPTIAVYRSVLYIPGMSCVQTFCIERRYSVVMYIYIHKERVNDLLTQHPLDLTHLTSNYILSRKTDSHNVCSRRWRLLRAGVYIQNIRSVYAHTSFAA